MMGALNLVGCVAFVGADKPTASGPSFKMGRPDAHNLGTLKGLRKGGHRFIRHLLPLLGPPLVQGIGSGSSVFTPDALAFIRRQLLHVALDVVELDENSQRLLGDLAAVVGPQLVELRRRAGEGDTLRA